MRTDAEVTAAAERTADLALRCVRLSAERDRARDIAVALEGQVAAVRALADTYDREADMICPERVYDKADKAWRVAHVRRRAAGDIRAALDPDPAEEES